MSTRGALIWAALVASLASCERDAPTISREPEGAHPQNAAFLPVQADEAFPALGCYQRARERTLLTQYDAYLLCAGATSDAPIACYERASAALLLSAQALALCRCAESVAPIECYERASRETTLTQPEIVALCSAASMQRLYPNCTPVR
ncbi:hypothetical protein [Polyangium jinanense]|uniref:Lipoprotein n=1 Tax=Polyangium jinanense TaxID=2829994 RepID=A0A9X3XBT1_9BACT|nr:hypothetical protein [Polyangium jinanense]MDC3961059.1 hypothetical protein [Polyangium jinanense]MDC3987479.1 hypothetical protein [Polyangium jinanense]